MGHNQQQTKQFALRMEIENYSQDATFMYWSHSSNAWGEDREGAWVDSQNEAEAALSEAFSDMVYWKTAKNLVLVSRYAPEQVVEKSREIIPAQLKEAR